MKHGHNLVQLLSLAILLTIVLSSNDAQVEASVGAELITRTMDSAWNSPWGAIIQPNGTCKSDTTSHCGITQTGSDTGFVEIGFSSHYCGRYPNGQIVCDPNMQERPDSSLRFTQFSCGDGMCCGLLETYYANCWGISVPRPILPNSTMYSQVAVSVYGDSYVCGLRLNDSIVECFNNIPSNILAFPRNSPSGIRLIQFAVTKNWGCGIRQDNRQIRCWNDNSDFKAFGDGPYKYVAMTSDTPNPITICVLSESLMIECNGGRLYPMNYPILQFALGFSMRMLTIRATDLAILDNGNVNSIVGYAGYLRSEIIVDPVSGNDTLCATNYTNIPCKTLFIAVQIQSTPNTIITVLPGLYVGGLLNIKYANTTIKGVNNAVTIDCQNQQFCFNQKYDSLTLQGLTIINSNGNAIISTANKLLIQNCTFQGHIGSKSGCVINSASYQQFQCSNSQFINNYCSKSLIQISSTDAYIDRSVFKCNSAGSAITSIANVGMIRDLVVTNSEFNSNIGGTNGSAGIFASGLTVITVDNCVFNNNTAVNSTGAILIELTKRSTITINRSKFSQNVGLNGGGISMTGSAEVTVTISNSFFCNNKVKGNGGSIFLSLQYCSLQRVTVSQCNFSCNSANLLGGAIYFAEVADATFDGSTFWNNSALAGGALALVDTNTINIKNTQLNENLASGSGAGVFIYSANFRSNIQISNSQILKNQAQGKVFSSLVPVSGTGGAISCNSANITIIKSQINQNSAVTSGGGVQGLLCYISVSSSNFSSNQAGSSGGAIALDTLGRLNIDSSSFIKNTANQNGGAIFCSRCLNLNVTKATTLTCNYAMNAGAIYAVDSAISIIDSFVTNNIATVYAGGLFILNSDVRSRNVSYLSNTASISGGVFFSDSPVGFNNNQFSNNSATVGVQASTYPSRLVVNSVSQNVYSGQILESIQLQAFDYYQQLISVSEESLAIQVSLANSSNTVSLRGITLRSVIDGIASFTDLSIQSSNLLVQLQFSLISSSKSFAIPVLIAYQLVNCPESMAKLEGVCQNCPLGSFPAGDACKLCPAGTASAVEFNTSLNINGQSSNGASCLLCPAGKFSTPGSGTCSPCARGTYSAFSGASSCISCNSLIGLDCTDGKALIKADYWGYLVIENAVVTVKTSLCPRGYCNGGTTLFLNAGPTELKAGWSSITADPMNSNVIMESTGCSANRLNSANNVLCGECSAGFIEWNGDCVECPETKVGLLVILIVASFIYVLILHKLSQSSSGDVKILLYFIQTGIFQIATVDQYVHWLTFIDFNPSSASGDTCVTPVNGYQQLAMKAVIPLFFLLELLLIMSLDYLYHRYIKRSKSNSKTVDILSRDPNGNSIELSNVYLGSAENNSEKSVDNNPDKTTRFLFHPYVRTAIALFLFSYQQILVSTLRYLQCVDVAEVNVVFTVPSIDCNSSKYKNYLPIVIILLAVDVALGPVILTVFLYKNREKINTPTSHFNLRYGILYSAYAEHRYFWQGIVLVRQVILVCLDIVFYNSHSNKYLAFCYFNLVLFLLNTLAKPYKDLNNNNYESASHLLLLIVSFSILSLDATKQEIPVGLQVWVFLLIVPASIIGAIAILYKRIKQKIDNNQSCFSKICGKRNSKV